MSQNLHNTLLRPAVLQILRAAGFNYTKPAVLDTVTDLAARYLLLLSSRTAEHAFNNHNDDIPDIKDVRLALEDVGALRPQLSSLEEARRGKEDLRGVEAFIQWAQGPANKEIRRIAGLVGELEIVNADGSEVPEDYLTALKKKYSKTGEESRYQGTVLGKEAEAKPIKIEGGPESIQDWGKRAESRTVSSGVPTPATSGMTSAPDTPMEDAQQ